MTAVFSSLSDIETRVRLDMNNPTFYENLTEITLGSWVPPPLPAVAPPPYTPRASISSPPLGKNALVLLIDVPEILAAIENGYDFGTSDIGWVGTSILGSNIFAFLYARSMAGPPVPSPTTNSHIAGGVIPGNMGSHVYGIISTVIEPTNLALHGTNLFFADAKDNRIRVVNISTGKVDNITLPIGGMVTTPIKTSFQAPSTEIETYIRAGGQYNKFVSPARFNTPNFHPDGSPVYNYTAHFEVDVKPYVSERGLENVPASRTGLAEVKALAVSPNGTVYFSDFVDTHYTIISAFPEGSNTRYGVDSTVGFEVGKVVTIYGFRAPPGDPNYSIDYGYNGTGIIQSFVANTSVTVNIASSGNPIGDAAFVILESRLRQIPRLAY